LLLPEVLNGQVLSRHSLVSFSLKNEFLLHLAFRPEQ
jgi:hypothetical protein